jgi:lipopolysaccharide biosynthesis glycosyltransferase
MTSKKKCSRKCDGATKISLSFVLLLISFGTSSLLLGGRFASVRQAFSLDLSSADAFLQKSAHICLIFDENRSQFALSTIRSIAFYASAPVVVHVLTPTDLHPHLKQEVDRLGENVTLHFYDIRLCRRHVNQIWFIAKHIHVSAMCKLFLADILDVPRILYLDTDLTVVQDVLKCWKNYLGDASSKYIAMGMDMGDACQLEPDRCFPIGFERKVGDGLVCGGQPNRSASILQRGLPCRTPGEYETYQFNGGVILMNLRAMRSEKFIPKLVRSSVHAWRRSGFRQARWGEQDMINNIFRLYPEIVGELSCGCNYQFAGVRRFTHCSNTSVVIAHGWTFEMANTASKNPYKLHFEYFKHPNDEMGHFAPPEVARVSPHSDLPSKPHEKPRHDILCSHQSHVCTAFDRNDSEGLPLLPSNEVVNVLTRTSGRPRFYKDMLQSVEDLLHTAVRHIVLTDDAESLAYINTSRVFKSMLVPSLAKDFDSNTVCHACANLTTNCPAAPSLVLPLERQRYLECYCNTSYPMNEYMNYLHSVVTDGWVVYLDDDNLFYDPFALSELLAHVQSDDELVVFRSQLGRLTPADVNFGNRIQRGDFDSSNMMFHSKHLRKARWPSLRCADFRVGTELAASLPIRWVNLTVIMSNPQRSSLGGLGERGDKENDGVVVIITSHQHTGWRPRWVLSIVEYYLSQALRGYVSRVLVVWNNQEHAFPLRFPVDRRFVFIQTSSNSLNSRWVATLRNISTETIALNLDDDVYVTKEGLTCLLNWHRRDPSRLIAPFVRRVDGQNYVLDELEDSSPYSVALPRILLLSVLYLRHYAEDALKGHRTYVDSQSAHCDDILLNIINQNISSKSPLRVLLPEGSVVDYYAFCWKQNRNLTGGLSLQFDRWNKRKECVKDLMRMSNMSRLLNSSLVGTCFSDGRNASAESFIQKERFNAMFQNVTTCGGQ